jgi:alpha-L-fucosidase 2
MLQSWDGSLRIFPAWPKDLDAHFEDLRAEGAFLVSAAWSKGAVTRLAIKSEKGGKCRLICPWPSGAVVKDKDGKPVGAGLENGVLSFETVDGQGYTIAH